MKEEIKEPYSQQMDDSCSCWFVTGSIANFGTTL